MPKGTDVQVGCLAPQSKQIYARSRGSQPEAMGFARVKRTGARTLFAGFVFNFSNSFCDCCFDASPLIVATGLPNRAGLDWTGLGFSTGRIGANACSGSGGCWLVGPRSSLCVCDPGSRKGDGGRVEGEKGFLAISGVGPDFASGIDEWMPSKHLQGGRVDTAYLGD